MLQRQRIPSIQLSDATLMTYSASANGFVLLAPSRGAVQIAIFVRDVYELGSVVATSEIYRFRDIVSNVEYTMEDAGLNNHVLPGILHDTPHCHSLVSEPSWGR